MNELNWIFFAFDFYSFECNPYLLKYFPLQSQFNVFFLYKMGVLPLLIQLLNVEIEWVIQIWPKTSNL